MKRRILLILPLYLLCLAGASQPPFSTIRYLGDTLSIRYNSHSTNLPLNFLSSAQLSAFVEAEKESGNSSLAETLIAYRQKRSINDWLYYQLIRSAAEAVHPKAKHYFSYTVYKWFLLVQSGYDARLLLCNGNKLLLYIRSDEQVYHIPIRNQEGKQFICLNYHDYQGTIDFETAVLEEVQWSNAQPSGAFSYKVATLPTITDTVYLQKAFSFQYLDRSYHFNIKVNPEFRNFFKNYPVVDYEAQFNMPVSSATYESLVMPLRREVASMNQKEGIAFLMRFTRYAFPYKQDTELYGSEKRMSPEQTLLSEYSDCEDRAALFYFLVKEIYNLPMLVLAYPEHVTVAVALQKPQGQTIRHNGRQYTICEPTPQGIDFNIGQTLPSLKKQSYQIALAYQPH